MLDNKTFLQGIRYIKANYLNWSFDLNDDLMLKVWYKKFSNLDNKIFMQMVEQYTERSKYPPNSPADLLEVIKVELESQNHDANHAWQVVIWAINKYGFQYNREKLYADLEGQNNPALLKTVKQFEFELRNLQVDDNYTASRFKQAYTINLKRQVEEKKSALLGTDFGIKLLQ